MALNYDIEYPKLLKRITALETLLDKQINQHTEDIIERDKRITELEKPDCEWHLSPDDMYEPVWSGTCGVAWVFTTDVAWVFTTDGPKENKMTYCPECGGKLIIKEQRDE